MFFGGIMNKKALKTWCQSIADLTKIPIRLYDEKVLVENYNPIGNDFDTFTANDDKLLHSKTEYTVQFFTNEYSFIFGEIIDKYSLSRLIIGPVTAIVPTQDVIKEIILNHDLPLEISDELKSTYLELPLYDTITFLKFLTFANTSINHTATIPELFAADENYSQSITSSMINSMIKTAKHSEKHISYDFEQRFLFYIRNGLIDEMDNINMANYNGRPGKMSVDPKRQVKSLLLSMNTLCIRAAIEGGLEPETAYTVGELYAQKIDLCNDAFQLNNISKQIPYDYCKRVHDLKYPQTSDLTIQKAIKYISLHVTEKISTTEIAENLGISRGYLSTRFKDVIGVSVTDYINAQKIREAKQLLKFSDKPLVAISNYLSFSSQSYFQNVFKSFTGKTPTEFRKEKDDDL